MAEVLRVAFLCESLNCLPQAGGLLDQDPFWLYVFETVAKLRSEKENLKGRKNG